jgi:hypothetical protein
MLHDTIDDTSEALGVGALRWEPCAVYNPDHDCALGTCVRCGWLCDDHDTPSPVGGAVVIRVDPRPVELRRAS